MEFTAQDDRLRPRAPLKASTLGPDTLVPYCDPSASQTGYEVTREAFPQLYNAIQGIFDAARLPPQPVYIQIENPATRGREGMQSGAFFPDGIRIGIEQWNRATYGEILFTIAHEVSHRSIERTGAHPVLPEVPMPASFRALNETQRAFIQKQQPEHELEADAVATSITGDYASAIQRLQNDPLFGPNKPPIVQAALDWRISSLQALQKSSREAPSR
jgi:hypothetical protein